MGHYTQDSDMDSDGGTQGPGKPGRKKNPKYVILGPSAENAYAYRFCSALRQRVATKTVLHNASFASESSRG